MPIYIYWGEDDFAIEKAIADLRTQVLDPLWTSFNYTIFPPEQSDAAIQALNQVMTPPFGAGGRLIWLPNAQLLQHCPENVSLELQRTLPVIPDNSYLLLTSTQKPDERLNVVAFGHQNEPVTAGQLSQGLGDAGEQFDLLFGD